MKPELGVPSLYYATHLDLTGEALDEDDYAAIRARLGRGQGRADREPGLPCPVTLADIAREAGTSASTASRALSGRGYVSPKARDRLVDVAERLGYVPNASAQTLKQRTSRVVGVVVSDLGNQFYAGLAAGIEQVLREANYQMVIARRQQRRRRRDRRRPRLPRDARARRDHDARSAPRRRALLRGTGIAVVEVNRQLAPATATAS